MQMGLVSLGRQLIEEKETLNPNLLLVQVLKQKAKGLMGVKTAILLKEGGLCSC